MEIKQTKTRTKEKLLSNGKLKEQLAMQSMILPGLILVIIFAYIPLFGLIIAFKDYNLYSGIFGSPWVGLKHFKEFFGGFNGC